jgi:hypothetical protein
MCESAEKVEKLKEDGVICKICGFFVGLEMFRKNGGEMSFSSDHGGEITKVPGKELICKECALQSFKNYDC